MYDRDPCRSPRTVGTSCSGPLRRSQWRVETRSQRGSQTPWVQKVCFCSVYVQNQEMKLCLPRTLLRRLHEAGPRVLQSRMAAAHDPGATPGKIRRRKRDLRVLLSQTRQTHQNEAYHPGLPKRTVVLPRLSDLVQDLLDLLRTRDAHQSVEVLVLDFSDAFSQILLAPAEYFHCRFCCVDGRFLGQTLIVVRGRLEVFTCLSPV